MIFSLRKVQVQLRNSLGDFFDIPATEAKCQVKQHTSERPKKQKTITKLISKLGLINAVNSDLKQELRWLVSTDNFLKKKYKISMTFHDHWIFNVKPLIIPLSDMILRHDIFH